jgi:alpha-mannosidase
LGHRVYTVTSAQQAPDFDYSLRTGENWVESDHFAVEFDDFSGAVTRLFDKRNQFETLRGPGNFLTMESEVGDLYRYARSTLADDDDLTTLRYSGTLTITETGPIRTVISVEGEFKDSTRIQRIFLYEGIHRVDLETDLQFHGRNKRVRLNFPLTVFSERVTTGSQFGFETKRVTPPDPTDWVDPNQGLFSALDWVDCSGPDFGVGLSAFGLHEFEFKDGVLSVTLLRSVEHLSHGRDDDVVESITAREKGSHSFKFSLLPHSGSWKGTKLWQTATEHRLPLIAYPVEESDSTRSAEESALKIDGMDLALSCYKFGPGENELTLRLYEVAGISGNAKLEFPFRVDCVDLVDLCEKVIGEIPSTGSSITLPVDAHSIITLRVRKASD